MSPVISRAGVTSKASLRAGLPGAAISTWTTFPSLVRPLMISTSSALRSSIGMSRPSAIPQSMVECGNAT